jgi:hypothetical protein
LNREHKHRAGFKTFRGIEQTTFHQVVSINDFPKSRRDDDVPFLLIVFDVEGISLFEANIFQAVALGVLARFIDVFLFVITQLRLNFILIELF